MTEPQALPTDSPVETSESSQDLWRKEIHARVAGYRNSRGRRVEGAYSMRFPFPPAEAPPVAEGIEEPSATEAADTSNALSAEPEAAPAASAKAVETSSERVAIAREQSRERGATTDEMLQATVALSVEPEPNRTPTPMPDIRQPARRKVIAFPRQTAAPEDVSHRLADPIMPEQPRILDVPEELEAFPNAPLLDGLQFLPHPNQSAMAPVDHIELPFKAVAISQRLYAGLIDCAIVVGAAGVFGAVVYKMLPKLVLGKPLLLAAGAVPIVLWAIYQYLLTIYGGATAGMRAARIRLRTFKGKMPSGRHRRSRVIGLYFSAASLMMGLLWALVDVDALCWHDRISRTYLTNRE